MKKKNFIIFISLLWPSLFLLGQESLEEIDLKKLKRVYRKSKETREKGEAALKIADYLKISEDSLSKEWYLKVIESYKNECTHSYDFWDVNLKSYYNIAISYFRLNKKIQAEVWFDKLMIISKDSKQDIPLMSYFYFGKLLHDKQDLKNALCYLNKFKALEGDTLGVNTLIENCKKNITHEEN